MVYLSRILMIFFIKLNRYYITNWNKTAEIKPTNYSLWFRKNQPPHSPDHGLWCSIPNTSTLGSSGMESIQPYRNKWVATSTDKWWLWLRKWTLIDLMECSASHIIPSYCHLLVNCRNSSSLWCSLWSYKLEFLNTNGI